MKFGTLVWGVWGPGAPYLKVVSGRVTFRSGGMTRIKRQRGLRKALLLASSQVYATRYEAICSFKGQMAGWTDHPNYTP